MFKDDKKLFAHFVKSRAIIDVINQSKMFNKTPAEIMFIEDEYLAFCFNQAVAYIRFRIEQGDELCFENKKKSFSDMYSKYDN